MEEKFMFPDTQFVRVKTTSNETFFVTCRPKDPIGFLKTNVALMSGKTSEDMRLYIRNRLLEDGSSLYEQQVTSESVLYLCQKLPNGEWEPVSDFLNKGNTTGNFSPSKTLT